MSEANAEVQQPPQSIEKKTEAIQGKKESPESEKSFFQVILGGFKEGV